MAWDSTRAFVLGVAGGLSLLLVACGSGGEVATSPVSTSPADASNVVDALAEAGFDLCSDVAVLEASVEGSVGGMSDPDSLVLHVIRAYAAEHADTFAGLWIDRDHGGTIVVAFTDDPAAHLAALLARRPSPDDVSGMEPPPSIDDDRPLGERDVAIDTVQAAVTEAELAEVQDDMRRLFEDHERYGLSGTGRDLKHNRVSIELGDPTPEQVSALAAVVPIDRACIELTLSAPQFADEFDVIPGPDEDPLVDCDGAALRLSDLASPRPVESVDDPAVDAFLSDLADPAGMDLPLDGWVVLGINDEQAVFALLEPEERWMVTMEQGSSGWRFGALGGPCDEPRVALPEGLEPVSWEVDPESPPPTPEDTVLHLRVMELGCSGGQPIGERLVGPQVVETDTDVQVAFAAQSPGPNSCPSNPWSSVTVELTEPLGSRTLRDGLLPAGT